MSFLAAAGDFLQRNAGHALNAGQNLMDYGSLHAPAGATQDYGTSLINSARSDPSNPRTFIDLAGNNYQQAQHAQPVKSNSSQPQNGYVLGASTNTPNTGANTGGATGSSSAAPASNPYFSQFQNYLGSLTGAYNSLFGDNGQFAQQAQSRENADNANYGSQKDALQNQYAQSSELLPGMYGARGIGSSSYAEDAKNYADKTFNDNMSQIGNAQTNDLAAIEAAKNGQIAQGKQTLQNYQFYNNPANFNNLSSYQQAGELGDIQNQLTSARGLQGSTGSNAAFLSGIAAPVQNQGTAQLQAQLSALAGSPTTAAAQNQIATGLINNSQLNPQQQQAAQGYWKQVSNS